MFDTTLDNMTSRLDEIARIKIRKHKLLKGHSQKVVAMDWSTDSRHLISASPDGQLIVWDGITTYKKYAITLNYYGVMTCAYSPGGNLVASGGLNTLCTVHILFPSEEQQHLNGVTFAGHEDYISCCRFLGNMELLTSSGDGTSILWDIETRKQKIIFVGHSEEVDQIDVSPSKTEFISGSCDSSVKLWDIRTGQCEQTFLAGTQHVNAVRFFPTGLFFATGGEDATCRLFDIRSDRQVGEYKHQNFISAATSVAFSKSGRLLFAGYDNHDCHVWDTLKEINNGVLKGHSKRISCLSVNEAGTAICTGSSDSYLCIWA